MKSIASKINTARYNWNPIVASFLLHMRERGFHPVAVDNGDGFVKTEKDKDTAHDAIQRAVEEACACDEANIRFHSAEGFKFTVFIVLGNEPHELAADYTGGTTEDAKAFDAAITEWSDSMEGMACPHDGMTAWHYLRMAQAYMVAGGVSVPPQLAADVLAGM